MLLSSRKMLLAPMPAVEKLKILAQQLESELRPGSKELKDIWDNCRNYAHVDRCQKFIDKDVGYCSPALRCHSCTVLQYAYEKNVLGVKEPTLEADDKQLTLKQ